MKISPTVGHYMAAWISLVLAAMFFYTPLKGMSPTTDIIFDTDIGNDITVKLMKFLLSRGKNL